MSHTDLLLPIPGDNPSGENLYSTPLFEQIREARREDDAGPQGLWEHAVKGADYGLVIKLTEEALAKKTKDLFLASWLTEALLHRNGFAGLKDGLDLIGGLIEQFWDTLYPELEDGDAEFRATPLDWLGNYLEPSKGSSPALAVRLRPITVSGVTWFQYGESRPIPTEEEANKSDAKQTARKKAIQEGKLPPEATDAAVEQSPKAFYVKLHNDIDSSLASLKSLDELCAGKFGEFAPSFGKLRSSIEEVGTTVSIILKKKRELEPDPVEESAEEAGAAAESGEVQPAAAAGPSALGQIKNRDDAVQHILAAVKFLRTSEPLNPAAYLVIRGLRWGELRAGGPNPDPQLLTAAPTETRTQVRRLALEGKWPEVLNAAEQAAGMSCGRGWLDLHRYTIRACEELGETYQPIARAVTAELRALLLDYPQLPEMCLMDDTPAANLETQKWIRSKILNSQRLLNPISDNGNGTGVYERAIEAVNTGNAAEAIEAISQQLARSDSGRSRFISKVELAQVLMAMGKEAVAYPILKELAQEVEQRKLEEWETLELVARPLALLYRCMAKLGLDAGEMQELHTRLCKLDVAQALSCLE
jgi:type VI secretion system protein ImpA